MPLTNHYGLTDQGVLRVTLPRLKGSKAEKVLLPPITFPASLPMGSPELAKYLQGHYPLCPHGRILEWYSSNDILVCKIHTGNKDGELPIGGTVLIWNTDSVGSKTLDNISNDFRNDFRNFHG